MASDPTLIEKATSEWLDAYWFYSTRTSLTFECNAILALLMNNHDLLTSHRYGTSRIRYGQSLTDCDGLEFTLISPDSRIGYYIFVGQRFETEYILEDEFKMLAHFKMKMNGIPETIFKDDIFTIMHNLFPNNRIMTWE